MSLFGALSGAVFSRGHYGSDNPPAPPPAPPPGPEIQVVGNNVTIANGDATPSATDHTDFGSTAQDSASSVTRVYTVRNVGDTDLLLSDLAAPFGFSITDPLLSSIPPSGEDTFSVHLPVSSVGTFSGNVTFGSNDPSATNFSFAISGEVTAAATAPEVRVIGNSIIITSGDATPSTMDHTDFGSVEQGGAAVSRTFTVQNIGDADLTTSSLTVPSGYTVTQALAATIAPISADDFTVELSTATVGTFAGNVSFANNDDNENPFTFAISGEVTAAAPPPPPPPPPPPSVPSVSLTAPTDGGTSTAVPVTATATATANSPATSIVSAAFRLDGVTVATDNSGPPWSVDLSPDNGTYSVDVVVTDNLGGVATSTARTHTVNVSPPAGTTLTTITIHNNSTTAQAADFVTKAFGHDFKQADIPAGDYPQFQLHDGTAVPYTSWGATEWTADGSFDFAGFVLRVPVGVAAKRSFTSSGSTLSAASHTGLTNGDPVRFVTTSTLPTGMSPASTYYIRLGAGVTFTIHSTRAAAIAGTGAIATSGAGSGTHNMLPGVEVLVKNGGSAPSASALTNVDITANSDLKVSGSGLLNISGTNTSSVNSGISAGNVFVAGTGPVGRVLRVRAPFNDGSSDNAQAGMWHYLFQLQNSSGGKYGLRWLGKSYNGFTDSTGTFVGKAFQSLDVKNDATTIRTMAPKATTKTLTALACGLLTLNNITDLAPYGGAMAVRITTNGTLPTGLSSSTAYYLNCWSSRNTLAFDGQTANFTAGRTVTGGTSGATATIIAVEDAGATGTLYLRSWSGVAFQDNETITDSLGGSATVNGTISSPSNEVSLYATAREAQSGTTGEIVVTGAGSGTHSVTVVPQLDCYAAGPFTAGTTAEYDFIAAGGTGTETTCDVIVNRAYRISTRIYGPRRETALPPALTLRSYNFESFQDYLYAFDSAGERRDLGYLPGYGFQHFHRQTPDDLQTIRVHGLQMGINSWSLRRSDTSNVINITGSTHANLGTSNPSFFMRWGATTPSGGIKAPGDAGRIWGGYDFSHQPFPHIYAYAITAEPHYLDMLFDTAIAGAGSLINNKQLTISGATYNGVLWKGAIQPREFGWCLNGMGWARRFAPVSTWNGADMRAYFGEIIDQNVASLKAQKLTHSSFAQANGFYPQNSPHEILPWQESYTLSAMCAVYGHYPSTDLAAHMADTMKNWNGFRVNHSLMTTSTFILGTVPLPQDLTAWTDVVPCTAYGSISWDAATDVFTYGLSSSYDSRYGTPTDGDTIFFRAAIGGPGGLSTNTLYYLRDVNTTAKTFKVAASPGGAAINITSSGSQTNTTYYHGKLTSPSNSDMEGYDAANSTKWKQYATSRWVNALGVSMPSGFLTAIDAVLGAAGSDPPPNTSFQNDTNTYDLAETF